MANDEPAWLYHLTPGNISELENAARHYLSLGRDVGEITAADFPLPSFADYLTALQQSCCTATALSYCAACLLQATARSQTPDFKPLRKKKPEPALGA